MQLLAPNQPLPPDDPKPRTKRAVGITIEASFNLPGGSGRIIASGQGSNIRRATVDAVNKLFRDRRLKGRRASTITPARFTVNAYTPTTEAE